MSKFGRLRVVGRSATALTPKLGLELEERVNPDAVGGLDDEMVIESAHGLDGIDGPVHDSLEVVDGPSTVDFWALALTMLTFTSGGLLW